MAIENNRPSIERYRFDVFLSRFKAGQYKGQRLGQAFYNEFSCQKIISIKTRLDCLFEKDGEEALILIRELFKIH